MPELAESIAPQPASHAAEPMPWELSAQLIGAMIVVLLLGLLSAPADDPMVLFREGRLGQHTSAILLAMAAALAFAAFLVQAPARARRLFWLVCACSFMFLAFDELMQLHVRISWWLADANLARPESLPRWDETIVTAYCALALLFCAFAMPEIRRHKSVASHLALGLVFFAGYAVAGSVSTNASVIEFAEVSCKVLANACFAIAMLAGLLSVVTAHRHPSPGGAGAGQTPPSASLDLPPAKPSPLAAPAN